MPPYIKVNESHLVYFKVINGSELTRKHIAQILNDLKEGVDNSLIVNNVKIPLYNYNTIEEIYGIYRLVAYKSDSRLVVN